jgi:3-isopropylmalate/(R)-2-methylmalate dehydratase small subunit
MEAFTNHRGLAAPLDTANVDTDQIIAKQFLKSIQRTGFGEHLFYDWRFLPDGKPDRNFALNQPRFQKASVLVARHNFGCGSSREHAVWAVQQYGFKAVIAPRKQSGDSLIPAFADIFRNNSAKNGLLTVELSETEVEEIFQAIEKNEGLEITVNLEAQKITLHTPKPRDFHFEIGAAVKNRLLHGLDDIGITLEHQQAITAFEKTYDDQLSKSKA